MAVYTIPASTGTPTNIEEIENAIVAQNSRLLLIENKILELSELAELKQRLDALELIVSTIGGDYELTIE